MHIEYSNLLIKYMVNADTIFTKQYFITVDLSFTVKISNTHTIIEYTNNAKPIIPK